MNVRECGFCHGGPVGDAARWLDGKPRPPAPCPRCGETYELRMHQALGVCWCGGQHTMEAAIALNGGAAA